MSAKSTQKISGTDWKRIDQMGDENIDTSEIPPLDEAFFQNATLRLPRTNSGSGDSVQEIADYWGNASIDDIFNRITAWKNSEEGLKILSRMR